MQPTFLSVAPDQLRPNPWNTNHVDPENEAKLEASIIRNGLFKPFVVRDHPDTIWTGPAAQAPAISKMLYEILGGQHRWEVVSKLGITEIPIYSLGEISDEKAKEIGLTDNARYGIDDTLALADLLRSLGTSDELQSFLPYDNDDLASIFSSDNIALDELDIDPAFDKEQTPEAAPAREAKTHTIMRFKVPLKDAESITALVARTQKTQGFTASDALTNAGDALVELLLGYETEDPEIAPEPERAFSADEIDELLTELPE